MLVRRFGLDPDRYKDVLRGYGRRAGLDGGHAFTELYEVVVIAGAIAPYASHPVFEHELRHRLRSLERSRTDIRWTPHRHLLTKLRRG